MADMNTDTLPVAFVRVADGGNFSEDSLNRKVELLLNMGGGRADGKTYIFHFCDGASQDLIEEKLKAGLTSDELAKVTLGVQKIYEITLES
jgi:hypothetical protein